MLLYSVNTDTLFATSTLTPMVSHTLYAICPFLLSNFLLFLLVLSDKCSYLYILRSLSGMYCMWDEVRGEVDVCEDLHPLCCCWFGFGLLPSFLGEEGGLANAFFLMVF